MQKTLRSQYIILLNSVSNNIRSSNFDFFFLIIFEEADYLKVIR